MAKNPPEGFQRIIPYLAYQDAPAAIEFLCKAFGFEERHRLPMPDGRLGHAELAFGDSIVMLASAFPEMGFHSPRELEGRLHAQIAVYVDDVDAHHSRALAAGATIMAEPVDQFCGDRTYRAVDCEGNRWSFHTHVRDVAPEDMVPPAANA